MDKARQVMLPMKILFCDCCEFALSLSLRVVPLRFSPTVAALFPTVPFWEITLTVVPSFFRRWVFPALAPELGDFGNNVMSLWDALKILRETSRRVVREAAGVPDIMQLKTGGAMARFSKFSQLRSR